MEEKDPESKFKFSYGYLMQLGDQAVALIEQDDEMFLTYGIDATYKTNLATKNQELKDFPIDEDIEGQIKDLTTAKDLLADSTKVEAREIMVRVKKVYKENTGTYGRFATEGLDRLNDVDLVKCGLNIVRLCNELLPVFTDKNNGITQTMIDEYETIVKNFDKSIDEQRYMMRKRPSITRDRLLLANEVYDIIVEVFDIGKTYWSTRNVARYKDYVIYNTTDGLPPADQQFGSLHGNVTNSGTGLPPTNGLLTVDGQTEIIEVDENGDYSIDFVLVGTTQGKITADGCADKIFNFVITLDGDTTCDIIMDPVDTPPPDGQ